VKQKKVTGIEALAAVCGLVSPSPAVEQTALSPTPNLEVQGDAPRPHTPAAAPVPLSSPRPPVHWRAGGFREGDRVVIREDQKVNCFLFTTALITLIQDFCGVLSTRQPSEAYTQEARQLKGPIWDVKFSAGCYQ
jgi:hypothetical protein